jgi:hypothetical protein
MVRNSHWWTQRTRHSIGVKLLSAKDCVLHTPKQEKNKTAKYHLYVQPWEDRFAALLHVRQVQEEGQDARSARQLLLSPASLSFISAEVRAGTLL